METNPALMISAVRGAEICRERGGDVEEGVGGAEEYVDMVLK
jgi:hypothetical protein